MRVRDTVYSNGEPIEEQQAKALAINEALRQPLSDFLTTQVRQLKRFLGAGIGVLVLGLVLLTQSALIGVVGVLAGLLIAGGGYYHVQQQTPEIEITGLEKRYWTGYLLPSEDGALVYDATMTFPETEFELEQVRNEKAIKRASAEIEDLDDFPVVMNDENDVETQFTELLDSIETELEQAKSRKVTAPVLTQNSAETKAVTSLISYADAETVPARAEVEIAQAKQDLRALSELGNLAEENPIEDDLEEVTDVGQMAADEFTVHQDEAIETLIEHIQTAADAFGVVSYNFYCPNCEGDDVESQLVISDDPDQEVYCETCRSYHSREGAIPRHKIKDELVLPTWDQLWAEKADEKRRIYENIEDQKLDLKEREYEQSREEIRTATERIRDLRSKIRDLKTQAKAAEGAVDEIGDLMVKYERLNEQRKEEFTSEVEEAFAEIDEETEEILEETRGEEQERLEEAEEEAEEKAEMLRVEERQRQAEMIAAQKEIAQQQMQHQEQMTKMQMGAEKEMTEAELEQQAEHHKQDWLLETRGETSFSDTINNMKYKKDQVLGASARGD